MATWSSAFIYGPADLYGASYDWLLAEVIRPFFGVQSMRGSEWFCVRYVDDGPHLRCRWRAEGNAAEIREKLQRAVERRGASPQRFLVREGFYEPEVTRYGGLHALPNAEALFFRSTQLAARTLASRGPFSASRRAGQAIVGMILLWCAAADEAVTWDSLAKGYELRLREMSGEQDDRSLMVPTEPDTELVRSIVDAARAPRSLPPEARRMFDAARQYAEILRQNPSVDAAGRNRNFEGGIGSQVHLHCNRLGVSPRGELILSTLVVRAIQRIAQLRLGGAHGAL